MLLSSLSSVLTGFRSGEGWMQESVHEPSNLPKGLGCCMCLWRCWLQGMEEFTRNIGQAS